MLYQKLGIPSRHKVYSGQKHGTQNIFFLDAIPKFQNFLSSIVSLPEGLLKILQLHL